MRPPVLFLLLTLGTFVFLAGYTVSAWFPFSRLYSAPPASETPVPANASFDFSWTTSITGELESISGNTLTLSSPADPSQLLELQLEADMQVFEITQLEQDGETTAAGISVADLEKGDRIVATARLGQNNTIQVARIDRILVVTP